MQPARAVATLVRIAGPFAAAGLIAFLDGVAEIALPVLLVIGLASRSSALGLLVVTGVIQLVVPDSVAELSPAIGGARNRQSCAWAGASLG